MILPPDPPTPEKPGEVLAEKAKSTYRWWNNLATINAEDPIWLGALKLLIRLVGIIVLLILSPFVILAVIIGFLAVI